MIDVPGTRHVFKDGEYLGGGRPGMPTVSPTTDGKWLMTFEYWGGGAERPLPSWPRPAALPRVRQLRRHLDHEAPGRRRSLTTGQGGSPVIVALPDGRMVFNAAGSGSVWTNDGTSTGSWTEHRTPSRAPTAVICNTSPGPGARHPRQCRAANAQRRRQRPLSAPAAAAHHGAHANVTQSRASSSPRRSTTTMDGRSRHMSRRPRRRPSCSPVTGS